MAQIPFDPALWSACRSLFERGGAPAYSFQSLDLFLPAIQLVFFLLQFVDLSDAASNHSFIYWFCSLDAVYHIGQIFLQLDRERQGVPWERLCLMNRMVFIRNILLVLGLTGNVNIVIEVFLLLLVRFI